ncbi:uncharacterized oxidoreductase [Faunimonas pinastri]|uniref:Uncharacterized oxidoreductase n=1 Tax=Faunimonas pinastri TaxID=1855383 RepID=A0A1H9PLM5_9HYPH|nr:uncharacterized oxidoreductase [Faunimonas pinastri]
MGRSLSRTLRARYRSLVTTKLAFSEKLVADLPTVNIFINSAGIMRMKPTRGRQRDLGEAEASVTSKLLVPTRPVSPATVALGHRAMYAASSSGVPLGNASFKWSRKAATRALSRRRVG